MSDETRVTRARLDPALRATLGGGRALRYAGARPADVPGHVRAGSAARRWAGRLVVVQDDVHALALVDEATGLATPLALPPGADGRRAFSEARGNKGLKMDLEACVVLPDGRLVALGSGSTARRQRLVVVDAARGVRVVDGDALYEGLRARVDFAGSELNVEGAVVVGDRVRLFQRGNGAPGGGLAPVDAIGDLELAAFVAWLDGGQAPVLGRVVQVDLGAVDGVRFGFTDATALPDGRVAFVAGAEDSPDAYRDGEVVGCCFGLIEGDGVRVAPIVDAAGVPTRLKLEGIEGRGLEDEAGLSFVVVADMDDPETPAIMATLRVEGSAPRRS